MPLSVNGEIVDDSLVRQEAAMLRPRMQEAMADEDPIALEIRVKEWARENVIERTLLRQAAIADPEPLPADVLERAVTQVQNQSPGQTGGVFPTQEDELRREVETQLRVDRLVERLTAKAAAPRHKDLVEYYRKNKESFVSPECASASHIVKNVDEDQDEATARTGIEAAQAELAKGTPFAEVADEHSDCPGRGGDLGWFTRGQMVEEFDDVVFALEPGAASPIFRTEFGFHIALLHEKRAAGYRPLEEVSGEIEEALLAEKRQKLLEQYLDNLRAKADVRTVKA
jgi:parvulin-like peptidyl-prolyl isomerase